MIFRIRRTSTTQISTARDDGNGFSIGSSAFGMNGTTNVVCLNDFWKTTDNGKTWTQLSDASWSIRNASGVAMVNGRGKLWAGNNQAGAVQLDSWGYDTIGGFTMISAAMTGFGSNRVHFASGHNPNTGLYLTVSGENQTDAIKSTDLITWTQQSVLPLALQNMSAPTMAYFKGTWWFVTGFSVDGNSYPGQLWKSVDDFQTVELVLTDSMFATRWGSLCATNDALFYISGTNGVNQRGCFWTKTPNDISQWIRFPWELPATHAVPFFPSGDSKIGLTFCGNMFTDTYEFVRIDKPI